MVDTTEAKHDEATPVVRHRTRRWLIGAGALAVTGAAAGLVVAKRSGDEPAPQGGSPLETPDWEPRKHVSAAALDSKWVGVYRSHDVADLDEFSARVDQPVAVAVVFGSENDWYALRKPWFAFEAPSGQDWGAWVREDPDARKLVLSTAMVPEDPPEDWRQRGAAGEYDQHWREYGRNLVQAGLGSSIVRLGWEMNGTWYETHYIGETEELRESWKEYFRRIVRTMEVEGSDFEIDFTIAEGPQNSVAIDEMYPGDDYVDIIGIDVYDSYIAPVDPGARWQAKSEKVNSVDAVAAFAASRDKPLSIPEWAMVAEGKTQGGGDSPTFVDRIADVVADHPVRYQAYFDVPDGGVGMTLADAPLGSVRFAERFGPSGDAGPTGR